VLHKARCLFRRTWQNECRSTCFTAAVWRSLLASQGGVPVSVGLPKMVCRGSPKASFEMPRSSFPTVGDAPIRRSGPPRHRSAPWPKPWRGSRLRGFLRPRAWPKPRSSLRLTVAETAVVAEGPNATHRSELRSTRRRWKTPDVSVVHRGAPRAFRTDAERLGWFLLPGTSWALWQESSTSRLCSANESVAFPCRCRQ
jgi:hypothetical protein